MNNILTGRARVVYVGDEFIHLSKGGLDGKIVAFKNSWLASSYDLQDWVTFKAKSYEAVSCYNKIDIFYLSAPKILSLSKKKTVTK